jgi:prepilin-type N-terminal cleavage/methylation domain-containing protein/prepilin-type processing-associated H-X9-DG protein
MSKKQGFTLIELLVVISVIAILLAILMPALNKAGELGKRILCLGNLKSFQTAWELYAGANDEKIVNGEVYGGGDGQNSTRNGEPYWSGDDVAANYWQHLDENVQKAAIQSGAIYQYVKSIKQYHCPTGIRGEIRNYSIVDSMNGLARTGTSSGGKGVTVGSITLWCKKKMDITRAATRMVFGDEGMCTSDSIATNYTTEQWWDPGQVRHSNGNTYSYADGHAEYLKWRGTDTISNGRLPQPVHNLTPKTEGGYHDLYKFQTAVWGQLGYNPTHSLI